MIMSNRIFNDFAASSEFQKRLSSELAGDSRNKTLIAKDIGISKDILIRAANAGVIPSTKSLVKIADYFETSIDYLLGYTEKDLFEISANPSDFQERIEELKKKHKIKNGAIATKIGISRSLFNTWKDKEYTPSLEIVFQLAKFFKVSMDYLLGRTNKENYDGEWK